MKRTRLDPELLEAFLAVADWSSFTKAAAALHRTQAAVSNQIRRLEANVGVSLFNRTTSRVELTSAGERLLDDARRILAMGDDVVRRLRDNAVAGRVRIGVMDDYGTRLMPGVLAVAASLYPDVEVDMETGLTARLLERLGRGFDLVIAMHPAGFERGELLRREEAVWSSAPGFDPRRHECLPLALYPKGCLFRDWALASLTTNEIPWRLAFVSTSIAAVEALVAQELAVTVLKRSMLPPSLRGVAVGLLPELPQAEIRLHRALDLSPPAALLADHIAMSFTKGVLEMGSCERMSGPSTSRD